MKMSASSRSEVEIFVFKPAADDAVYHSPIY